MAVGGVYGSQRKDCVEFYILGSTSRGIPRREWEIPFKDFTVHEFAFYPQANVVAIAGNENGAASWE
jgi:hypothetical protein